MIAEEDIKIGAKVVFNYSGDWGEPDAVNGNEYLIVEDSENNLSPYFKANTVQLWAVKVNEDSFTLVPTDSIARPILAERKVGKCQMHMVDDGFPRALRHIAEIMTWADEAKQYKLHDWRNLPNPEVEFPAAEYRHKNDNSTQKAEGLSALERVDPESGKLHIGHKLFNALCELELILTGKIK